MICTYKATIPESKIFYRIYELKSEMTLFEFNSFILSDLGFSPDQMVLFEAYDDKCKFKSEYGLFDTGDGSMDKITFDDVLAKGEVELRYIFDLRNNRYIKLTFTGEGIFSVRVAYPQMVECKGIVPDQFSAKYEEIEEFTIKPSKNTSPGRSEDFDDEEEDEDDNDDEENDEDDELLVDEDFGKEE